ncbi:MAG TPA: DUF1330 domain-containing protein [Steroidobacteraceae bacterium]
MAAYMIASFDIADRSEYEGYVPGMMPILQKYNPEILVADYACKALEGESRGVNVVIKFESEEILMAFYNDPAYRPFKEKRLRSTSNGTLLLAREFALPA